MISLNTGEKNKLAGDFMFIIWFPGTRAHEQFTERTKFTERESR